MNCPGCNVELSDSEAGVEGRPRICSECGGLNIELAELRPILLHNNLPGFEALGGRVVPNGEVGECPTCQVDLVLFESDRQDPQYFEICEECGFVFIAGELLDASLDPELQVVAFFRRFASKKARPAP